MDLLLLLGAISAWKWTLIVHLTFSLSSPDGGVDIEEVAEKTPDRIKKVPVDIHTGVTDAMATELAEFLGFKGELVPQCAEQIKNLYTMFLDVDCLQLEVNPLAETPQGKVSRWWLVMTLMAEKYWLDMVNI